MDKLVTELEQLTQQGIAELATMDAEQLAEFMESRGRIMDLLLQVTVTPQQQRDYKGRIQAVLSLDGLFLSKMEHFRDEAKSQLVKIDAGKTQRSAYDAAFTGESFFFDRKK